MPSKIDKFSAPDPGPPSSAKQRWGRWIMRRNGFSKEEVNQSIPRIPDGQRSLDRRSRHQARSGLVQTIEKRIQQLQ